jgi:hypothetical protein
VPRAAARQLLARCLPVLLAHLARRLAVEVEPLPGLREREQVGRAHRVAAEELGQHLLRKEARRALEDVGMHAQLDGLGRTAEQGREHLLELLRAVERRRRLG